MDIQLKKLDRKSDERGYFEEVLRQEDLPKKSSFGQIGVTAAKPGVVKGNHYHTRKVEWYYVTNGKLLIALEDNATGEKKEIVMTGEEPSLLRIGPNISHAIKNIGTGLLRLIIYTSEPYFPDDPDTFKKEVL